MAHVAATSNHLPPMSPHIWQSHPRQHHDQSINDTSPPVDLPVNTALPPSTEPQPSLWHTRSPSPPPPLSDHVPQTPASSSLSIRQSPPPTSSTPEVDLTDADAVFRNLLNLRIEGNPPMSRPVPVQSAPFRPPPSAHPSLVPPRLASPLIHDFRPDLSTHGVMPPRALHPSAAQPPSSVLMSLQGMPPLSAHSPAYHPSTAGGHEGQPPPRPVHDLRSTSITPGSHVDGPVTASPMPPPPSSAPRIKNELYKTEICRSFAENGGFCKYGAKCQFAHGEAELRPVRRHPRYKTKLCRNFVTTGSCPYDARCRFIHATDLPFVQNGTSAGLSIGNHGALVAGNPPAGAHANAPFLQQLQQQHQLRQQQLLGGEPLRRMNVHDSYVDNMHSFAPLPASSAAFHRLDNYNDVLKPDIQAAQTAGDLQTEKLQHHAIQPMDQVYHANANVFHDYPDNNSFHNTFMHLSGVDAGIRFPPNDFSDPERDPVLTTQHIPSSSVNVIGMNPQKEPSASSRLPAVTASSESLFSHQPSGPNKLSTTPTVPSVSSAIPMSKPEVITDSVPNVRTPASTPMTVGADHIKGPMGTIIRGDIENDNPAANRYTLADTQGESLFTHPPSSNRSLSPALPGAQTSAHAKEASERPQDSPGATVAVNASPAPRSRLPVFRNMSSDADGA